MSKPLDEEQLDLVNALLTIAPTWMRVDIRRISAKWTDYLHPKEQAIALGFAHKRRLEFATGRASARHLIGQLVPFDAPILIGDRRAPIIPGGVLASISHCDAFVTSVATNADNIQGVGVDIESHDRVTPDLVDALLSCSEKERLKSGRPRRSLASYFSAKEAAFKAIHGLIGRYIDFLDIDLTIFPDHFLAQPLFVDSALNDVVVKGQVTECGRHVIAVAWVISLRQSDQAQRLLS